MNSERNYLFVWDPHIRWDVHFVPDHRILEPSSLITGFLSSDTFSLEPTLHITIQASSFRLLTLRLLCAMSLVQLLSVQNLLNAFQILYYLSVTILVDPTITGMAKQFISHIH
jgi:hypothetical protein